MPVVYSGGQGHFSNTTAAFQGRLGGQGQIRRKGAEEAEIGQFGAEMRKQGGNGRTRGGNEEKHAEKGAFRISHRVWTKLYVVYMYREVGSCSAAKRKWE